MGPTIPATVSRISRSRRDRRSRRRAESWPWHLPHGDVAAEIEWRGDGGDGLLALADAHDCHVAIIEQTAEDALVDVDALDLVQRHLEGAPLDEPGLVHHAHVGDVGL